MGHIPEEMEDKWFWYMEDTRLYAHRSWTGINVFIVDINAGKDEHKVIVNRDPKEYSSTSATKDEVTLNHLLDYWTQPVYDYYTEWLQETLQAIEDNK